MSASPWRNSLLASLTLHAVALAALATLVPRAWDQLPTTAGLSEVAAIEASWLQPRPEQADEGLPVETPVVVMPERAQIARRKFHQESTRVEWPVSRPGEPPELTPVDVTPPQSMRRSASDERFDTIEPTTLPRRTPTATLPQIESQASLPQSPGFDALPQAISNPPPSYPPEAVRNGWQGRVVVRLTISAEGDVREVEVMQASGQGVLDAAAVRALRQWRFRPAQRNGRAIESTVRVPVDFRL